MANRYNVPNIFVYQQKPIPSESVNQNNAAWAAAVNELVDDFRGASPPDNPVEGMTWLDTSGSRPVHRIYEGGIFKWFGIFVGTTAEKPLNPRKGAVFFDTTLSKAEYFNGTSWVKYSIAALSEDPAPALGGNLTVGSYKVGDATAADLTKLHGITATVDELNYVDGVTSAIQTQLDAKTDKSSSTLLLMPRTSTSEEACHRLKAPLLPLTGIRGFRRVAALSLALTACLGQCARVVTVGKLNISRWIYSRHKPQDRRVPLFVRRRWHYLGPSSFWICSWRYSTFVSVGFASPTEVGIT